ncbi:hypothetical protein [Roseisolibacter sp. H3M3-2]|uniref:hypothetical protein n=1 Tax=Roseisolibacter sp. H3M3-2 TaxID=3031323 RepID=UPI0023D9C8BF|nr:hypothetical protein [Roseisolibacter sp. H3M3-2]MDF1504395.1 hypothetical protein [Roseisolibacter sp. H3M3-2]
MPSPVRALALLLLPAAVAAQPAARASVDSGTVVRVTAPARGLHRVRAVAESAGRDSLRLRVDGPAATRLSLAWSEVATLDRSIGVDRAYNARRGAGIGALVLAVPLGGAAAVTYLHAWRLDRNDRCRSECYLAPVLLGVGALLGTGAGALLGAAIGAGTNGEGWEAVRIPVRVGVVGNGLGGRLTF